MFRNVIAFRASGRLIRLGNACSKICYGSKKPHDTVRQPVPSRWHAVSHVWDIGHIEEKKI